jgi:hypothetical protein
MEASITGPEVLGCTSMALHEGTHARAFTIVGHRFNHRESGPAIGAGDKGVPKSTIVCVGKLAFTGGAGSDIR